MEIAEESRVAINYERFKLELKERFEDLSDRVDSFEDRIDEINQRVVKIRSNRKPNFFLPFKGDYNMRDQVYEHLKKIRDENRHKLKRPRLKK